MSTAPVFRNEKGLLESAVQLPLPLDMPQGVARENSGGNTEGDQPDSHSAQERAARGKVAMGLGLSLLSRLGQHRTVAAIVIGLGKLCALATEFGVL